MQLVAQSVLPVDFLLQAQHRVRYVLLVVIHCRMENLLVPCVLWVPICRQRVHLHYRLAYLVLWVAIRRQLERLLVSCVLRVATRHYLVRLLVHCALQVVIYRQRVHQHYRLAYLVPLVATVTVDLLLALPVLLAPL